MPSTFLAKCSPLVDQLSRPPQDGHSSESRARRPARERTSQQRPSARIYCVRGVNRPRDLTAVRVVSNPSRTPSETLLELLKSLAPVNRLAIWCARKNFADPVNRQESPFSLHSHPRPTRLDNCATLSMASPRSSRGHPNGDPLVGDLRFLRCRGRTDLHLLFLRSWRGHHHRRDRDHQRVRIPLLALL